MFHAGVGSSHVGMLLPRGVPESALALEAPPGHVVVDAAAYTEGRCLVLLQPAGGRGGGGGDGGEVRERGHGGPARWRPCVTGPRGLEESGATAGTRSWTRTRSARRRSCVAGLRAARGC